MLGHRRPPDGPCRLGEPIDPSQLNSSVGRTLGPILCGRVASLKNVSIAHISCELLFIFVLAISWMVDGEFPLLAKFEVQTS